MWSYIIERKVIQGRQAVAIYRRIKIIDDKRGSTKKSKNVENSYFLLQVNKVIKYGDSGT